MANFFEKLKKGMDIDKVPEIKKAEEQESASIESKPPEEKKEEILPDLESTPIGLPIEKTAATVAPFKTVAVVETETETRKEKTKKEPKPKTSRRAPKKKQPSPAKKPKIETSPKKKIKIKEVKETTEEIEKKGIEKSWFEPEGQLVVDLYEADGDIIIQSAIAGVKPDELDISIDNDMVIIKGKREKIEKEQGKNYFYQECHWGYFSREIILPNEVDAKRSEATMKNGILTIKMPKIERGGKRKIAVIE